MLISIDIILCINWHCQDEDILRKDEAEHGQLECRGYRSQESNECHPSGRVVPHHLFQLDVTVIRLNPVPFFIKRGNWSKWNLRNAVFAHSTGLLFRQFALATQCRHSSFTSSLSNEAKRVLGTFRRRIVAEYTLPLSHVLESVDVIGWIDSLAHPLSRWLLTSSCRRETRQ